MDYKSHVHEQQFGRGRGMRCLLLNVLSNTFSHEGTLGVNFSVSLFAQRNKVEVHVTTLISQKKIEIDII